MKAFRRALAAFLVLLTVFSFVSCSDEYPEIESSELERTPVFTMDGGAFEVPYEMYRFLFLSEKKVMGQASFSELNEKATRDIAAFYAVFSLAQKYGVDPYSDEMDDEVTLGIKEAVEGVGDYTGYGTHDAYLAKIKEAYMNDSVFRFLLRYDALEAKLGGVLRDNGVIASDKETVLSYIKGEECVRVTWIYISGDAMQYYTDAMLQEKLARAKSASNSKFLEMTHEVLPDTYTDAELEIGFYLGRYQLDPYYEALSEAVFSLEEGETSNLVYSGDGVYIVRRLPKDMSYVENEKNLADFTEYYLLNTYFGMIHAEAERLLTTVSYTEFHASLTMDSINMSEE